MIAGKSYCGTTASLVVNLLVWFHLAHNAAAQSLSSSWSDFDPFLATDIPTITLGSSSDNIPLQSPDLDSSSDYLGWMTTASYSLPPQSSSAYIPSVSSSLTTPLVMTATASISITTATTTIPSPGNITTTAIPPTTTPSNSSQANVLDGCVQGSGVCFMNANQLGARGTKLQSQSLAVLLLVALMSYAKLNYVRHL